MSLVENHNIVQIDLDIAGAKRRVKELTQDKHGEWQDLRGNDREMILHQMRTIRMLKARRRNLLSFDHCVMQKASFRDYWTYEFTKEGTVTRRNGKKVAFHTRKSDVLVPVEPIEIPIDPMKVNGFINRRKSYQFFQVMKVDVKFTSNKATNFSPIRCRYAPPSTPAGLNVGKVSFLDQMTKVAASDGKSDGYMSLNMPNCLVKINDVYAPSFENVMLMSQFNEKKVQYDFGRFIFETSNDAPQSIEARVEYKIDFYSMVDYDNIPVISEGGDDNQPGDGDGDDNQPGDGDGDDNQPGDGDGGDGSEDGDGNQPGDGGDGDGSEDGDGGNVPAPRPTVATKSKYSRVKMTRGKK